MSDKLNITLWGREFSLDVKYDCYAGEEITEGQKKSLDFFRRNACLINDALTDLKSYCTKRDDIGKIDNIFKYVMPEYIFVKRTQEGISPVGLMCAYRFDEDDGIALVLQNDRVTIGSQNILL